MEEQLTNLKEMLEKDALSGGHKRQAASNILSKLGGTLAALRQSKPAERNELARRYAVTITELEKVYSYFYVYVFSALSEGAKTYTDTEDITKAD